MRGTAIKPFVKAELRNKITCALALFASVFKTQSQRAPAIAAWSDGCGLRPCPLAGTPPARHGVPSRAPLISNHCRVTRRPARSRAPLTSIPHRAPSCLVQSKREGTNHRRPASGNTSKHTQAPAEEIPSRHRARQPAEQQHNRAQPDPLIIQPGANQQHSARATAASVLFLGKRHWSVGRLVRLKRTRAQLVGFLLTPFIGRR